MRTLHFEHEIACDEDAFWKVFLDADYTTELFRDVLGFPHFEILEEKEEDGIVRRECAAQPKLPKAQMALARLLRRRGFHFIERGRFERATRTWTWDLEPNVWKSLLTNRGKVKVEPLGNGERVRRVVDIEIGANIPGVGKMIEGSAAERMRAGWNDSARFMNEWIASHASRETSRS